MPLPERDKKKKKESKLNDEDSFLKVMNLAFQGGRPMSFRISGSASPYFHFSKLFQLMPGISLMESMWHWPA